MNWLGNLPLKRKFTLAILCTCLLVLLVACAALAVYELYDFRRTMVRDDEVLADVLAKSTQAALAFQDESAAQQTLLALQVEPDVSAACLYTGGGDMFASYVRQPGGRGIFSAKPEPDGYRFERGHLLIFRPVVLNGRRIGTIFVRTDLQGLYDRLQLFLGIAALVLLGSGLTAFGLSSQLQRPILRPILALEETVRRIAAQKDYSVRAPAQGHDEIGSLTDSFNQLLASIADRDFALRNEITERKGAEARVQSQLARLEMLHRITRAISERQDLQSIFQVVIRTLEDHLPVDFCCVGLYEPENNTLAITSVGVRSGPLALELALTREAQVEIDQNGLGRCVRGTLVHEPDVSNSKFSFPQRLARGGLRAVVFAPLLLETKVFGVLLVARRQPGSFSSGECEFLRQLSEHVALAAHQAHLYEALQQAYNDLRQTQQAVMQQERLKALGQMASGIAHDINNAISPVALYTESLLERESGLTPRGRDYLTTIQHAVEDVAQTVARMREFYRQQEPQLKLTPVNLSQLAEQVVELSRARWSDMPQSRGVFIELVREFAPGLPAILGVDNEIREALLNLVFNAVDAMPSGGKLTLRTRATTEAPRFVSIEVSDSGVGMDDDTRRRCLEPFFTTKGERGTGLGLAMVYGIARRHHAEIEIESAPGAGTTMRLKFPAPASPLEAEENPPETVKLPPRMRILIVDDDPLLIKSLRDTLESDGHQIIAATGGQEGIDIFRKAHEAREPFAAVITDLGMPYVDGRQVAATIKGLSPATPVIMLTGWGQRLVSEDEVPPDVDFVLNKPPKLRELRATLLRCAPKQTP
jgi:signal transduction histidine kinase/ActR/RegA family two-component response regulator/HAMP domain-containing protein